MKGHEYGTRETTARIDLTDEMKPCVINPTDFEMPPGASGSTCAGPTNR